MLKDFLSKIQNRETKQTLPLMFIHFLPALPLPWKRNAFGWWRQGGRWACVLHCCVRASSLHRGTRADRHGTARRRRRWQEPSASPAAAACRRWGRGARRKAKQSLPFPWKRGARGWWRKASRTGLGLGHGPTGTATARRRRRWQPAGDDAHRHHHVAAEAVYWSGPIVLAVLHQLWGSHDHGWHCPIYQTIYLSIDSMEWSTNLSALRL